ncbi:hypothetical protein Dimus_028132 [Dionaea muscipula]
MGNSTCKLARMGGIELERDESDDVRVRSPKTRKVLQVVKLDGKIIEFDAPIIVKDLLAMYPSLYYIGAFRGSMQPLPLHHKLKVGGIYYLLSSSHDSPCQVKRVKMVITKQQLKLLLSKGIIVDMDDNNNNNKEPHRSDDSTTAWRPTLEAIPE